MHSRLEEGSLIAADKIADLFAPRFFDDQMVYDVATIIKHHAELIVRECDRMIENEAAQYAEPVWAVELVNDIKERFGVEQ